MVCETARRGCLPVTEDIDEFETRAHRQNKLLQEENFSDPASVRGN